MPTPLVLPPTAQLIALFQHWLPFIAISTTTAYGLWLLPQLKTLLAAEGGRKKDLVRRSQVQGFDFDVIILLPFTEEKHYLSLVDCLACLTAQQYPQNKMKWVVLATPPLQGYQANFEALAGKNGSPLVWLNAPNTETETTLLAWGCRTTLSQWQAQLIVFLHPSDLVKPDFLNQLTAKAYSHEVIQGYVASRDSAGGRFHQLLGIETRMTSRIETAGRYHAKKPLILRDSGFAIKTTLLEQLPWPSVKGHHASWLYSLALAQYKIPIVWAPTVVVYKRGNPTLATTIETFWQEAAIRLSLGLQSFGLAFKKSQPSLFSALELTSYWWTTPWALTLAVGISLIYAGTQLEQPNTQLAGIILTTLVVSLQLATLGVSRLPWQDWVAYALLKPLFLVVSAVTLPYLLLRNSLQQVGKILVNLPNLLKARRRAKPSPLSTPLPTALAPTHEKTDGMDATPYWLNPENTAITTTTTEASPSPTTAQTPNTADTASLLEPIWETVVASFDAPESRYTVPLLFGKKSVEAQIEVENTPNQGIQLTLQYKQQSFKTAIYPLFSQAFYELQEKLSHYNIQVNSCGGCAYYFQPASALQATQQKQVGLCLKQLEQQTPIDSMKPITVLSETCQHQAPLGQRGNILSTVKAQLLLAQPV